MPSVRIRTTAPSPKMARNRTRSHPASTDVIDLNSSSPCQRPGARVSQVGSFQSSLPHVTAEVAAPHHLGEPFLEVGRHPPDLRKPAPLRPSPVQKLLDLARD